MSLELISSPILATIQDRGRFSYTNIGLTNSGVMDEYAYFMAHKILRNNLDENIIEISFSNIEFKVHKNTTIAITGASCEFFIDGIGKNTWASYNVKKGSTIKIGKILEGVRVYLAVKGGFKIKKEFGSYSTTLKEKIGGLNGDKLKKGDILDFDECLQNHSVRLKKKYIPKYEDSLNLRVFLSYQEEYFPKEEKEKFFSSIFEVSNEANRMGIKLKGEKIFCDIDGIISEGICFGSIQIPKSGEPIILLKDRQTIGGYPKIGTVLTIDCFKLAQAKAKTKIKFIPISLEEAQREIKEFYKSIF